MSYHDFMAQKFALSKPSGIHADTDRKFLAKWQSLLVHWALRRGRAALFADTGLGKTRMQLTWADSIPGRVLLLAPLAVAKQTEREAAACGIDARYLRDDDPSQRIVVTNYDILDRFAPSKFEGVVLDESSILKAFDGKTRTQLIESFAATPYRLACTATPAPNDYTELGNHSEFLGEKTRTEMLAEYFVHDMDNTQDWRIKGHAKDAFWRWVCSWGAIVRKPSDIGGDDDGYDLPALNIHHHICAVDHIAARESGSLFATADAGLAAARRIRRATIGERVEIAERLVRKTDSAIVWCEMNDESSECAEAIDGAVEVKGSDSPEAKEDRLLGFASGKYRVIVSKPSIAGFGLNWQHCNQMVFLGASYSYEQTYQAIRRCWRFRQTRPVDVHMISSEADGAVVETFRRKAKLFEDMMNEASRISNKYVREAILSHEKRHLGYNPKTTMEIPSWLDSQSA